MKYPFLALIIALTYSCSEPPKSAFFGGEIVNPSTDYVYLYHNNELLDSSKLNENNRFSFRLENLKEGLYHFDHNEYQYIILEKGDSLLMRLNTLDFDESLVFSGKGAEKNNFLIDMFLIYENEENLINRYSELTAEAFLAKIDSLKQNKKELLKNFNLNKILSSKAEHIVEGAINYSYFTDMEEFPFIHKRRNGLSRVPELPSNYYDFRTEVNYNDTLLMYYKPYFNYLVVHFNNLAYNFCKNKCNDNFNSIERSLHYNTHKLKLIDSIITENNTIRDNLTRNVAFSYLLQRHSAKQNEKFIETFHKYAPNNQHEEEIDHFYQNVQALQKGLTLPTIHLINVKGNKVTIDANSYKKNTVFYFWNYHQKAHQTNVLDRISLLKENYPNYNYIGINVNEDQEEWIRNLASIAREDDSLEQYQTDNVHELFESLVIKSLNKIIVVDENGKIVDGFGDIYHSKNLEHRLREKRMN